MELVVNGVSEEEDSTNDLEDRGHRRVLAIKVASLVAGRASSWCWSVRETLVDGDDLGHL